MTTPYELGTPGPAMDFSDRPKNKGSSLSETDYRSPDNPASYCPQPPDLQPQDDR